MNGNRVRSFICAVGLLASLSACQQTPDVPENARLLYYGPVEKPDQINGILSMDEIDSAHQVYVYDDSAGKVVAVRTVDGHHRDLNFSWVEGQRYRIYFY
ncbi:MAG: hypothetical protein ABSB42_14310 [Tepidisphaeraceae bacterium]|jgi:hypothetical protein